MSISEKAKKIKLLILDVDGVLTDGRIVYNDSGEELKFFDIKDGHGIKLLMREGIHVAIITGRRSPAVGKRAADLGIEMLFQGVQNKMDAYEEIIKSNNLTDTEVGAVGDDLLDLPVLKRCGLSFAVPGAAEEVKGVADVITRKEEGRGAVREVCEYILKAQGLWEKAAARSD